MIYRKMMKHLKRMRFRWEKMIYSVGAPLVIGKDKENERE